MSEGAFLEEVFKKDDDAFAYTDPKSGVTILQTTAPLGNARYSTLDEAASPNTLIEDAASEPHADVTVRVVRVMFFANSLFLLSCLLFGLPLYMWHTTLRTAMIVILAVAAGGIFPLAYGLSLWFIYFKQYIYTMICTVVWWVSGIFIVGAAANLAGDAAPFQFILMLWAQCISILIYTRISPRQIISVHAMLFMTLATMGIWGLSIGVFFYDRDWIVACVILLLALLCVLYHGYQIRACESRYSMRDEDLLTAVVQFYGDPILYLVELAR